MALVNRKVFSIVDSVTNFLDFAKNKQRGIVKGDISISKRNIFLEEISSSFPNHKYDLLYGEPFFVVVGTFLGYYVYTSPNGITWTARGSTGLKKFYGVAYNGTNYVIVGETKSNGKGLIAYSSDCISWTEVEPSQMDPFSAVVWGDDIFVAVGSASTADKHIYSSPDGIIWTQRTTTGSYISGFIDVAYGNNIFIATSLRAITGNYYSEDGITWSQLTTPAGEYFSDIVFFNGYFIAKSLSSFFRSTDGTSWEVVEGLGNGTLLVSRDKLLFSIYQTTFKYSDNGFIWHDAANIPPYNVTVSAYSNNVDLVGGYVYAYDILDSLLSYIGTVKNNWAWKAEDKMYIAANTQEYEGSWEASDSAFKVVTLLKLYDSFVTAGIALGESGETALDGFVAVSLIGALNELRRDILGQWVRVIIDGTNSSVKPKQLSATVENFVHTGNGLMDFNVAYDDSLTVGDVDNLILVDWYDTNSLFSCFNRLITQRLNRMGANRITSDQAISADTATTIIFNYEGSDTFAAYSIITGIYTVTEAGVYHITTGVYLNTLAINNKVNLRIKKNTTIMIHDVKENLSMTEFGMTLSGSIKAAVGDELLVEIYSSASCNVDDLSRTNFNLHKLD